MGQDLHREDFVAWSEAQAALLRRHAAGEPVRGLDWPNIIEEVEDLGRSETQAVRSLLLQAMIHALKIARWPEDTAVEPWRVEASAFLVQARDRYLRSMRNDLDADALFRKSCQAVAAGRVPPGARCPVPLDALLDDGAEPASVIAALGGQADA